MPSTVADQIDAREATIASFRDPAREEMLVAAARNGNEQAFEILVKRHEQRILAIAQRYTRAQEDAKDVVQQTFQKGFCPLAQLRIEVFVLHLANAHRHQRRADVAAPATCTTRGTCRPIE